MRTIHPKYFVPNGFTAMSMLFGLASIGCSAAGNFTLAGWLILWGVLLDKLDGTTARLFNASSEFGVQYDSFADFVSFGLAPAGLCYFRLVDSPSHIAGGERALLIAAVGLFVIATSARLARFNISEPPGGDKIFYGIPTTLVGAFLASAYLTWENQGWDERMLNSFPALLIICGVLMVSNLKLPKLKRRKNAFLNLFQVVNIVAVYLLAAFRLYPEYPLLLVFLYVSVGMTWTYLYPPDIDDNPPEADAPEPGPTAANG